MTKSYVGMGHDRCPICATDHGDSVLIHKNLKEVFEDSNKVLVSIELCPDCKAKRDESYIALVEIDAEKSGGYTETIKPENAWRLGGIAWVKAEAWKKIFDVPVPEKGMAFVGSDVIAMLEEMMPDETDETKRSQT